MPRAPLLLSLLTVFVLVGCQRLVERTGSSAAPTPAAPAPLLREVSPQQTDPAIDAWAEAHLVALDPAAPRQGRLFVFFSGSYGTPTNQRLILEQAARGGYHAIGLRYPNRWTINDLCGPTGDPACFDAVRLEILDGEDRSPLVQISPANSIRNRLAKLLAHLARTAPEEGWDQFLDEAGAPRWALISAGGHSQGGGHAALLGKREPLARVCMLSAPFDAISQGATLTLAPWLAEPGQTPPGAYFGLASEREAGYERITAAWAGLGMMGAAAPTLADDAPPDLGGAQALVTRLEPSRPGQYHGSTAVDRNTPLRPDGTPALAAAWAYLCFPPVSSAQPPQRP